MKFYSAWLSAVGGIKLSTHPVFLFFLPISKYVQGDSIVSSEEAVIGVTYARGSSARLSSRAMVW
jgi:hypothetical protein